MFIYSMFVGFIISILVANIYVYWQDKENPKLANEMKDDLDGYIEIIRSAHPFIRIFIFLVLESLNFLNIALLLLEGPICYWKHVMFFHKKLLRIME